MKLFLKADVDEGEIIPKARVSFIRVTSFDVVHSSMFIVRTPFKRWVKYMDWSFGDNMGWCTFTFAIRYAMRTRKFEFHRMWEPIGK